VPFLLPILSRLLPALGILLALWFAWHKLDTWCNGACEDARAELVTAQGQIQAAQERATALALLWSEAINRVEVNYVELAGNRADATAGIRERAGRIRPSTSSVVVRVSPDALRVLGDVAEFANDSAAPEGSQGAAAPVPDAAGAAETTLADWVEFAIEAGAAYREAADKHQACVSAYDLLRSSAGAITDQGD
jgi:hypothetical protein